MPARQRKQRSKKRRLITVLVEFALFIFIIIAGITFLQGQSRLAERKETLGNLEAQIHAEQDRGTSLADILENGLTSEYVEGEARKSGFIYPDERVFYDKAE